MIIIKILYHESVEIMRDEAAKQQWLCSTFPSNEHSLRSQLRLGLVWLSALKLWDNYFRILLFPSIISCNCPAKTSWFEGKRNLTLAKRIIIFSRQVGQTLSSADGFIIFLINSNVSKHLARVSKFLFKRQVNVWRRKSLWT